MGNIFDTPAMAAGYAKSRPAVHPDIIERARKYLPMPLPVENALDVGCGAGLSTKALQSISRHTIGIDPSEAMVKCASTLVTGAEFMVGTAESLPVAAHAMDIITAAGSLDYAELTRFFPEALRVLATGGVLLVYDFSQGRSFRESDRLDAWFAEFLRRYPMPPGSGQEISPEMLKSYHPDFRLCGQERFEISLKLAPDFYLNYVMTETNVAHAVLQGEPQQQVRTWCGDTLAHVFQGVAHEVLFRGYLACMAKQPV